MGVGIGKQGGYREMKVGTGRWGCIQGNDDH